MSEAPRSGAASTENEERLRRALEGLPAFMWVMDQHLRLTTVMGGGLASAGIDPRELLGKKLAEVCTPDALLLRLHRDALAGKPQTWEMPLGAGKWLTHIEPLEDADGAPAGIVGLALDTSKQRIWLDTILRSIADGVIAVDRRGRVRLVNRVAEQLTGWSETEAAGQPLGDCLRLIDSTTREPIAAPLAALQPATGTASLERAVLLAARDGGERAIVGAATPLVDADGVAHGHVLIFRDQTAAVALRREVERAQRLSALAVLAGGIAHDFNNMLSAITANVSLARREVAAAHATLLDEVLQACDRATSLTRQLLTFARQDSPLRAPTDMFALIRSACSFATRGSRSECTYDIDPALWHANVDAGQIAQVLTNLVLNADEAMPGGGTVVIRARNRSLDADAGLPVPSGRYVEIAVEDRGVGIQPEELDRIFDPFYSTKMSGSGLGLASTHSIVALHGGHITVASTPGAGTQFAVLLPATDRRPASRQVPAPGRLSGRVLILDDDQALRLAMARVLAAQGLEPDAVADGATAIERYQQARAAGRPYDLVILDLTVRGGMGGVETLAHLRAIDPGVTAIASSGYTNTGALHDPSRYGFAAVLPKPYTFESILVTVERALDSRSSSRS